VALVAALASNVELLILDEPTAGLDPLMEAEFRNSIEEDRDAGRTVLLASHILAEVEALCDRISIVRKGRTVESGTLSDLRHLTRTTISAELSADPARMAEMAGVHDMRLSDHRVDFEVDSDRLAEVVSTLATLGVRSLVSHPPTLEELFMRHYQDGEIGQ
jgi:ABC-2 type transport system ATP-binding protein